VLLDYIGFEDANDTEIYECDILEDDWNRRLSVEWHRGGTRTGQGNESKRLLSQRQ
jgi:hypothetical protein